MLEKTYIFNLETGKYLSTPKIGEVESIEDAHLYPIKNAEMLFKHKKYVFIDIEDYSHKQYKAMSYFYNKKENPIKRKKDEVDWLFMSVFLGVFLYHLFNFIKFHLG